MQQSLPLLLFVLNYSCINDVKKNIVKNQKPFDIETVFDKKLQA